jgi:hypothetical protein
MSETHLNEKAAPDDCSAQQALRRNPDDWTTGEEPMTTAQRSYLQTLSDEAGEKAAENLTKADASKRIDDLQRRTGRGQPANADRSYVVRGLGRRATDRPN